jgi:hypothetical protein
VTVHEGFFYRPASWTKIWVQGAEGVERKTIIHNQGTRKGDWSNRMVLEESDLGWPVTLYPGGPQNVCGK